MNECVVLACDAGGRFVRLGFMGQKACDHIGFDEIVSREPEITIDDLPRLRHLLEPVHASVLAEFRH